ncbi:MAG TPA: glutamine-hydrolyzing GMP synthase [Trueperaceae bacterium]|nr:glutamine-hydrolyzing GMP synthase [Trueperaceae bacterium]
MASIVVIDYGSQYTRLITRRLRELNVYSVIVAHTVSAKDLSDLGAAGVILSGGPRSVTAADSPGLPPGLLELGVPILAICYGMQLIAREAGGRVLARNEAGEAGGAGIASGAGRAGEYGKAALVDYGGTLFDGVEGEFVAWMSHGDSVVEAPSGFEVTATTESGLIAAMEHTGRGVYCLQFHPEVRHTPKGAVLLERFVETTGLPRDWTAENIVQEATANVRAAVGSQRVLLAISGGVDSSTLGLLLNRAIHDQLVAVFVDHGLLRLGEADEVERALRALGVDLHVVDAKERFLRALAGVSDPETKRKIIGGEFIKVFEEQARALGAGAEGIRFLAQGTLYPDVIESAGTAGAAVIKSHHNVGGLPADLGFELIEPFRNLFKDEVREVAEALGLPPHLRERHPFPGPGLAIRIIGEVTKERLELLARVDDVFVTALREFGLYLETWQALAVLTQVRSVGVMGDERSYGYLVALRAVTSVDGMTADWARLPHEFLATVSSRIVNAVPEVNRVVYDITSKPPGTIEWE